jgi:hypothetical protein
VIIVRKNNNEYHLINLHQETDNEEFKTFIKEKYSTKQALDSLISDGDVFQDYEDALIEAENQWADNLYLHQNGKWYYSPLSGELKLNAF